MSKIFGVHHIALTPTPANYDKTIGFYKDILGFNEVRAWGEGDNRGCMLSCGDNTVMEIMSNGNSDFMGDGSLVHLAFCCDEVEEVVEAVRAAGYLVTKEPTDITLGGVPPMPVRIAFFRGPVNEHLELFKVY